MISKTLFCNMIRDYQYQYDKIDKMNSAVEEAFPGNYSMIGYGDKIHERFIELLVFVMSDNSGLIEWYLYELDENSTDEFRTVEFNGNKYKIDSPEALYDLLRELSDLK